jgi:predicted dehydrogenase
MNIAIVGCGFVADLYMATLSLHPWLQLTGAYDRDEDRRATFASHHGVRAYDRFEQVLDDPDVSIVVNLTNPRSHYDITRASLDAGKHVYSEKPLAMSYDEALQLVELAERKGLYLAGAPCTVLSETAQTMWKAVRDGVAGRVRLVYAEMDEGLVPRFQYRKWFSASGRPWPYRDEFEIGCTLEHAGYVLTWLAAMFGPARSVTAFSSVLVDDKLPPGEAPLAAAAADFSVACITFADGVVARMTNSIVAPHDHRFRVFGDRGELYVTESWATRSPVKFRRWITIRRRTLQSPIARRMPMLGRQLQLPASGGAQVIDFARGVAELADAIGQGRPCRLGGRFALHVTELALATQNAMEHSGPHVMRSTFDPVEPMPWAT